MYRLSGNLGASTSVLYVLGEEKRIFFKILIGNRKLEGPSLISVITTTDLSVYKYVTTAMLILPTLQFEKCRTFGPASGLVWTQPVEESVLPVKQHLGRERFHSNEEVEMAIREWLRLINLLRDEGEK